jgi:hypothetical protein
MRFTLALLAFVAVANAIKINPVAPATFGTKNPPVTTIATAEITSSSVPTCHPGTYGVFHQYDNNGKGACGCE